MENEPTHYRVDFIIWARNTWKVDSFFAILRNTRLYENEGLPVHRNLNTLTVYIPLDKLDDFKASAVVDVGAYAKQEGSTFDLVLTPCTIHTFTP